MTRALLICAGLLAAWPVSGPAQLAKTANPHGTLRTSTDCSACHTPTAWKPARPEPDFDHNTSSRFALAGKHKEATCKSCHLDLRFDRPKIAASDCASCHVDVHLGQLSTECASCHTTQAFTGVSGLALHARTSFPLSGSHLQISCESCHKDDRGGAYGTLVTECVACHEGDYASAENVDHVALNFTTNCERCHTTLTWSGGGDFDHITASNGFALLGAHASIDCTDCHDPATNALRFPTPASQNDCVACHQDDYDRQHGGSGFSNSCLDCHTQTNWEGASFDHFTASNGFDLLGTHATLACADCHDPATNALRFPTPASQNDCVACHQDDYDRQHGGSGFSTSCLDCHTQDTWLGATFEHDQFFPINSGIHSGKWKGCETCHSTPGNYQVFTCFSCHQHSQTRMDNRHSGVSGYTYDSNACYSCHPIGRA